MNEEFMCYAYSGVPVYTTEEDCKTCEMGKNGCPAYPHDAEEIK